MDRDIFALLDPDPGTSLNPDPDPGTPSRDPEHCIKAANFTCFPGDDNRTSGHTVRGRFLQVPPAFPQGVSAQAARAPRPHRDLASQH